ncbi:hypothetical protein GCM10010219_42290 [Streptomyces netropsis]|nr:hypothetical protein GCM10010219_42290 [Streptomyces netropsis]
MLRAALGAHVIESPTGAAPRARPAPLAASKSPRGLLEPLRGGSEQPRPDVIVILTDGQTPWPEGRPSCRTVVGLFPRQHAIRSWDENDPDYVPDSPPAWARVVDIGSSPAAR